MVPKDQRHPAPELEPRDEVPVVSLEASGVIYIPGTPGLPQPAPQPPQVTRASYILCSNPWALHPARPSLISHLGELPSTSLAHTCPGSFQDGDLF